MEAHMATASAEKLTDHQQIRQWAEARGGRPSKVETGEPGGILRFDFGDDDARLTPISWNEFFQIFEDNRLAVLAQDETADGRISRFVKFVER
jgi:hypothetical protein